MISLIFPTYNESGNIEVLYERLCEAIAKIKNHDFEFIFIDDCSSDQTPQIIKELHQKDKRVKTVRFSRNSGSHAALTAGLYFCKGDCAIVMAADLQDPPEIIGSLVEEWQKGFHIVWGVRKKRNGELLSTRIFSRCYYFLINWLTAVKMPPLGADVFLANRDVLEAFKKVPEKHTSVFMALAWLGFKQSNVYYIKNERFSGKSKWSLKRKIKLTIDSILAFSDVPIRYMSLIGFLTAILGFIYAVFIIWSFFHGSPVQGWSSLIIVSLVIGGIQMMMLGVLGEYLWRTYDESRRRPGYIEEYRIE